MSNRIEGVPEHDTPNAQISQPRTGRVSDRTDRSLIQQVRRGSRAASEELATRYWDDAYRTAYLILREPTAAEDVAQESMLAAFATLSRFRATRPFAPWLHRITVNRAIDRQRSSRRRRETTESVDPVEERAGDSLRAELASGLADLTPEDRAIVVLRHVWDYSSAEIARMVRMPTSTVRTRLQRSLATLKDALDDEEER